MYVLIDRRNLKLRWITQNKDDIKLFDDMVVMPTFIITDLNRDTALLNKYDGVIPENWHNYSYYYDRETDTFKRAISSRTTGRMVFR